MNYTETVELGCHRALRLRVCFLFRYPIQVLFVGTGLMPLFSVGLSPLRGPYCELSTGGFSIRGFTPYLEWRLGFLPSPKNGGIDHLNADVIRKGFGQAVLRSKVLIRRFPPARAPGFSCLPFSQTVDVISRSFEFCHGLRSLGFFLILLFDLIR